MNRNASPAATSAAPAPGLRKRRRVWRALLLLVVLAMGVVALLPSALSVPLLRDWALRLICRDMHGKVTVGEAHFGWLSPVQVRNLRVSTLAEEDIVVVTAIETERPLWQLVLSPRELGVVRIEQPDFKLVVRDGGGNNFRETFPSPPSSSSSGGQLWKNEHVRLDMGKAWFDWHLDGTAHHWDVELGRISVALEPAWLTDSGRGELVLEPAQLLDHWQLKQAMCDDVLKFIVPILAHSSPAASGAASAAAKATTSEGKFSLSIDGGRLPLDRPVEGHLAGKLTLHEVKVGPGPLVRGLAELLHLPSPQAIRLADESVVEFRLADGRVHHEGLEFGTEHLRVRTSGSVGPDQSLDLLAEVKVQLSEGLAKDHPLLGAFDGQSLRIPVRGTLNKPEFDFKGLLKNSAPGLAAKVLKALQQAGEAAEKPGAEPGAPMPDMPPGAAPAAEVPPAAGPALSDDAVDIAAELLRRMAERRRKRGEERATRPADPAPPPAPPSGEGGTEPEKTPPRRGPLGRIRDRLRQPLPADSTPPVEPAPPPMPMPPGPPAPDEAPKK